MAEAVETIEVTPEDLPGSAGAKARGEPVTAKDIGALVSPPPDPTMDISGVAKDLAGITRQEIADRGQLLSGIFGRAHEDQDRAREAFEAEGVGPNELKPWDAEQERRKYQYDPMEAFGSFGSVFATIASAFTRRPMINALNASAAAMEATRTAKKEDFQNAYQAWKDNNDLVIKRHNMMHQQYQDAISLMDTDLRLGTAKLSALAAQYGDQKLLAMLDHGMFKEAFEILDARTKAVKNFEDYTEDRAERLRKNYDLNERLQQPRVTKKDIPRILREWKADNEARGARSEEERLMANFREQYREAHGGQPPSFEEEAKAYNSIQRSRYGGTGANTNLTAERRDTAKVAAYEESLKASGKYTQDQIDKMGAKYARQLKEDRTPLTPKQRDELYGQIGQLKRSADKIDALEKMMVEHGAITGLGGEIRRPAETVIDILGGDANAAKLFKSNLIELQEWVGGVIRNKLNQGRLLSRSEERIADIVPGLKPGDTVAFVAPRLLEVKQDLMDMMREDQQRAAGTFDPQNPGGNPSPAGDKVPDWQRIGIPQ